MIDTVLFDLDGTLTDPAEGILNAVVYALQKFKAPIPEQKVLHSFIGPPLTESFQDVCGFDREKSLKAVDYYREYFAPRGIFENRVYPGVPQLLSALKEKGKKIVLATSKPEEFAVKILAHYGLKQYFDAACGGSMDESRNTKDKVIAYALKASDSRNETAVMVGDRKFDITGGRQNGLQTVGVLYGYGSRAELLEAGADYLMDTVPNLKQFLLTL